MSDQWTARKVWWVLLKYRACMTAARFLSSWPAYWMYGPNWPNQGDAGRHEPEDAPVNRRVKGTETDYQRGYRDARAGAETVVSYVVEARKGTGPWLTMATADDSREDGEAAYQGWLSGRGALEVRLVRRTAVITDEVVSSGRQWNGGITVEEDPPQGRGATP